MLINKTYAVLGGDLRNSHLANILAERETGDRIYGMFLENGIKLSSRIHKSNDIRLILPQSDVIILPLPMLDSDGLINTPLSDVKLSIEECLDYIPPDAVVLGGRVPEDICMLALDRGIEIVDYMQREEFAVFNAVPTAEGAVEIALRELPTTLSGTTCMVTGYGRISRVLVKLLLAFGAKVRVAARRHSDLAWIEIAGAEPVHIPELGRYLHDIDVLFNTVPAILLGEEKLARLKRNCLVIDLASKPGGVDFDTAKKLELKTIWALSLPGKVAPISAGEITLDTICNILCERGVI